MVKVLFWIAAVVAVVVLFEMVLQAFWIAFCAGALTTVMAVYWAKRAHSAVPLISYFSRKQGRWRLPALAFAAGASAQLALGSAYNLTDHEQTFGAALSSFASWGVACLICGYLAHEILRGRLWKVIFDAAPIGGNTQQNSRSVSSTKKYRASQPSSRFTDLYGNKALKESLIEAAAAWKGKKKNGILLFGPPGTGKTAFAEALAGELDLPTVSISVGDLSSKWINETTQNLTAVFDSALAQAPCLLFFDEVEAVLEDRSNRASQTEESGRTVATFLARATALQRSQVLLVAATNFPDRLDAAAVRDGRFDFKIEVPLPDDDARRGLITARLARAGCSTDPDTLTRLSRRWAGFNIPRIIAVTDAACDAVKARGGANGVVAYPDFYAALRRVQGAKAGAPEGTKKLNELILEPAQESRLREIADQLVHVDEIERAGGTIPKGILFFGPPGTGKTATAMALAAESGWSFVQRAGRELLERGAVEKLRLDASDLRPAIVFLDEADDVLADRQFSNYKMVTNELLTLVDGAGGLLPDVVWVAATNHVDSIDEAALRAGRFEQKLEFGPPTRATARRMVLAWAKAHADHLDRSADVWTDAVLADFAGLTAANVFGSLAIANNIAVARARSCGEHSPVVVTPAHVAEAVGELTGIGAAAVCT